MSGSSLVYLASPYSDPDHAVMEARFEAVCREAAVWMGRGVHVFSPIAHTHPIAVRGDLPKDWTFWEQYDRVMLAAASELWVLTLDGHERSRGVAAEVAIAGELGIPVRYVAPEARS